MTKTRDANYAGFYLVFTWMGTYDSQERSASETVAYTTAYYNSAAAKLDQQPPS